MAFGDGNTVRGSGILIKLSRLEVAKRLGTTVRKLGVRLGGTLDRFELISAIHRLLHPYKLEELVLIHDAAIALQMDRRKLDRMIRNGKVRSFVVNGLIYVCLKDFITNTK